MKHYQLIDSLKLLNRIKEIDARLAVCRNVKTVTLHSDQGGFVAEYDTAKMYAAKVSAELISTRRNLVDNYLLLAGEVEAEL